MGEQAKFDTLKAGLPAYDYVRDDGARIVYVRAHRVLSASDVFGLFDRLIRSGAWTYGLLYDLQLANGPTTLADSDAIAARSADLVAAHGPRGPVAIVSRDVRMLDALAFHADRHAGVKIQLFVDFDDAKEWLAGWKRMARKHPKD